MFTPNKREEESSRSRREKSENGCDSARKRESLCLRAPRETAARSLKSTRKREEGSRGGNVALAPAPDGSRHPFARDGNRADSTSGNSEEGPATGRTGAQRETVHVRETKASRLRAATRAVAAESEQQKSPVGDGKEKMSSSSSPLSFRLDQGPSSPGKRIDKSLSRKSHLNRSHTSEGVYDRDLNLRRRRVKNLSLDLANNDSQQQHSSRSPAAAETSKTLSFFNGSSPEIAVRSSFPPKKSEKPGPVQETSNCARTKSPRHRETPAQNGTSRPVTEGLKKTDAAAKAKILAASTLKMITRLDEINSKTRRGTGNTFATKPGDSEAVRKSPDAKRSSHLDGIKRSSSGARPSQKLPSEGPKSPKVNDATRPKPEKPSILKNRTSGSPPNDAANVSRPVSILKRKSLSHEESQSNSPPPPPVTFSPSVLRRETDSKRQGILKKRRSLDESEVRRRSANFPTDDVQTDFKSILKTQRRSSMEELTRTPSPTEATAPQGILKRKSSREEEGDADAGSGPTSEPQGILKRKWFPEWAPLQQQQHVEVPEVVRPILKKKSSSEDHSASDLSLAEAPKSILKKKTSLESEDVEEKPTKPILKSSRTTSSEDPDDCFHDPDLVKPILKKENGRIGPTSLEGPVILRRVQGARGDRPYSSPDMDTELRAVFLKRRSFEFQPLAGEPSLDLASRRRDALRGILVGRSTSALDNIVRVLDRPTEGLRSSRSAEKGSWDADDSKSEVGSKPSEHSSYGTPSATISSASFKSCDVENGHPRPLLGTGRRDEGEAGDEDRLALELARKISFGSSQDLEGSQDEEGGRLRSVDVGSRSQEEFPVGRETEESGKMEEKKGEPVSSATGKKDEESRLEEEKEASGTSKGRSSYLRKRLERKALEERGHRYHTQPVTSEDVELAVQKSRGSTDENSTDGAKNYEDEFSTLSYLDRIRLFEQTTCVARASEPKKRGTRFKTQPVTTLEVETAKSKKLLDFPGGHSKEKSPDESEGRNEFPSELKSRENGSKLHGILKSLCRANEDESPTKASSDVEDGSAPSEEPRGPRVAGRKIGKAERDLVSELKGILKRPSVGRKDEDVCQRKEESRAGNLSAILQKIEAQKQGTGYQEEPRRPQKWLQNEGIARIIKSRNSSPLVKSQSHASVSSAVFRPPHAVPPERLANGRTEESSANRDETDDTFPRLGGCLRRSTTQPFGHSDSSTDDDMSGATIQERLARLKRNGELNWQKRKSHVSNVENELSVITSGNYLFKENCVLRNQLPADESARCRHGDESRNSILADRLGKLDAAKEDWKKRVQPSDAARFSVEGKMLGKSEAGSPPRLPLLLASPAKVEREKRSPKAVKFRSKQPNPSLRSTPSSPMEQSGNPIARSVSAPGSGKEGLLSLELKETCGPVVAVPKIDDEAFASFFTRLRTDTCQQERLEINDEDLDVVTSMNSSQLLVQKRSIKTQRRRTTVRNPLKTLAARLDLQEYTEIKTDVAEKELKKMKIEKAAKTSNLAIEALAGLASQEDFTAISLKKASEGSVHPSDAPYRHPMLLHVKGRRHVQTRLVEPLASSLNSGDCFVLVTATRVYLYVGEYANVIERSRSAEIAAHVQQQGDLGCSAGAVVTLGENGKASRAEAEEFWRILGGGPDGVRKPGNPDEDEVYESSIVDTNMVYEVAGDELVPEENFWGSLPKIELLSPNKILVFDFGSEFYVWNGKNVSLAKRKIALKLARELWKEGFDYLDCDLCPITAASFAGEDSSQRHLPDSAKAGPSRPPWALFAKINQNMETVLFREKFADWPNYSRIIRKSKGSETGSRGDEGQAANADLRPCDSKQMAENQVPEPDLVLEGSHLGRGNSYFDEETRRCSEISSQDVTVWHVNDYEYSEVAPESLGHFHMEDSYVVRWHYTITITGRELSGHPSKHITTGRDRYAYFCWQGRDSPVNDKGAAACLTVELDKERGPQVRVVQGYEPPAFVNLFRGGMVVHAGRRFSEGPGRTARLFMCRGEWETESVLVEVPCSMRHLRSLASFVLVNKASSLIIVWHGWKSQEHSRQLAVKAAKRIQTNRPREFGLETEDVAVREELEGSESSDFLSALGGGNRKLYHSLLGEEDPSPGIPRLFHLTSVFGEFHFAEVTSPQLGNGARPSLPFLQSDLYSASQPALFLFETTSGLWLWQGWREENSETADRGTGSGNVRFQSERRAAMLTAMSYWAQVHGDSSPKAYLIWAGLEPLVFTNQFPFWTDRDDIAEINMKDGRTPGEVVPVKVELDSLTQSYYPLSQLQNRPLPDGVNPTSLEEYLEPECFQELFNLEREEFFKLPSWKKKKLKQEAGLF